jgi:hypothetical protein
MGQWPLGLPHVTQLSLSPDGQHVAGLLNMDDSTVLFTRGVNDDKIVQLSTTDNQLLKFSWIQWASNERIVFSLRFASRRDFVGNGIPGQYYLGDRKTGNLSLVAEAHPDLLEEQMAGKRPVHIKARDGLLPHSGPHGRDPTT